MPKPLKHITVLEHEALFTHKGNCKLTEDQLVALQNYYKEVDFPFYSLVHKGIRFCEYVGVIQVGGTVIEILPKADKQNKEEWRSMLIGMLKAVGLFDIHAPTSAHLKTRPNALLDLYFEMFIQQTEELLYKGLIKTYRKTEANTTALKGSILFGKHIQQNLTHQERFYVKHTVYDKEHPLNRVLYKTIKLLQHINTNVALQSRINALLLNFPELAPINVDAAFFEKIEYNRKTEPYKKAIEIARLILLNYHPDVSKGNNNVLALMFDMNALWEQFVYISLKKNNPNNFEIKAQVKRHFWKRESGQAKRMIPDIVVKKANGAYVVLDTKWKNIGDLNPSDTDLRQMYTYSKFHNNAQTGLIYPGNEQPPVLGNFYDENNNQISNNICAILKVPVVRNIKDWQESLAKSIWNTTLFEQLD